MNANTPPPMALQAEAAILAAILCDQRLAYESTLQADQFADRRNRYVWESIQELLATGGNVDHITVANHLDEKGVLEHSGGMNRFFELNDLTFQRAAFRDYVEIVQEAAHLRKQIDIMNQGIETAYGGTDAVNDVMGKLAAMVIHEQEDRTMEEHCEQFLADCKTGIYGHFGWWDDQWTQKLGRMTSELIILHAPRSTGKTAIMLQWMIDAHRKGQRTPLASIEMLKKELASRFIANLGDVGTFSMRSRGFVTEDEERRSKAAIADLRKLNLCIRDRSMSIDDICAWALREKQHGVDALFIDNLLSISDGGKSFQSKTIMYDYFIRRLRDLRDQLSVPIILLAHPNAEGGIAWSKDVENFADIILYLTEVPTEGIKMRGKGNLITRQNMTGKHIVAVCQKNRNGLCPFYASLDFIGATQRFEHVRFEE